MTASTKPKTPSMSMTVRSDVPEEDIDGFCKKATRLALSHIVDKVVVKERLILNGGSRSKEFTIDLVFYPRLEYEKEYDVTPTEILAAFGTRFPLILKRELKLEMKKLDADLKNQAASLGKGQVVRGRPGGSATDNPQEGDEGEDREARSGRNGDDDAASEIGDGDATAAKRQRQAKEQATYDDDEGEDAEEEEDYLNDAANDAAFASPSDDESDADDVEMAQLEEISNEEISRIQDLFIDNLPEASSFSFRDSGCSFGLEVRVRPLLHTIDMKLNIILQFSSDTPKLLLVGIVEKTCLKTVIREIPGITDCFKSKETDKHGVETMMVSHSLV